LLRRLLKFLLLATIIISSCPAQAYAVIPETSRTSEAIELSAATLAEIDAYLAQLAENAHLPALAFVLVSPDQTLLDKVYSSDPNITSGTPFYLGSLSKSFTALAILRLAEQGRLSLDDTLATYLPSTTDGDKITIRQLLNRTSGLNTHQTLANYHITEPQGIYHYANINYTLLGRVIEQASGQPYADFLSESLFAPLGLSRTSANLNEDAAKPLAPGHTNYFGFNLPRNHHSPTNSNAWITAPAGYIAASAHDMGRYLRMYLRDGEDVLSPASLEQMFEGDLAPTQSGNVAFAYGYGWNVVPDYLSETVYTHDGLVETGATTMFILPESHLAFALLSNTNDYLVATPALYEAGYDVARLLLGERPAPIPGASYVLPHLFINLILLAVLFVAIWPLFRLRRYRERASLMAPSMAKLIAHHFLLPALLLLLCPLVAHTPLWVVHDFVPDIFWTIIISASLLFLGGFVKLYFIFRQFPPCNRARSVLK